MTDLDRSMGQQGTPRAGGPERNPSPASPPDTLESWASLSEARRESVVEALIFAAERPVGFRELQTVLGCERAELAGVLERLRARLAADDRGVVLTEVAGGLVFRTKPAVAPWIRKLVQTRPARLSQAALETLAIVAYQQPVTRAEVEAVRGVESGSVLRTLLEKRLVRVLGRKEDLGRPLIYGTSREFLRVFGLKNLAELPAVEELEALLESPSHGDPGEVPSQAVEPGRR